MMLYEVYVKIKGGNIRCYLVRAGSVFEAKKKVGKILRTVSFSFVNVVEPDDNGLG